MNPQDRKLEILHHLSLESEPISLTELVQKLNYNERTIRRWLNRLIEEGVVSKSGTTKDAKYFANKELQVPNSSGFSPTSAKIISKVKRPIFERYPVAYNEQWLESYVPNKSFYLPASVRKRLFQTGKRASDKDPAGTYAQAIYNRLLIDLSYNSSRLEGNTFSLLDTERLILFGDAPEGKLNEEKIMILNHKEAIRYLVENASKIIVNQQIIFTLHYLLSDGLLESRYAGKVRDHFVRISGSSYTPYENPKKLEGLLGAIADKASKIKDPFEQSFFLLIHISYLQAFSDVNKRTARLAANIPLITNNLVPLSFNDVNREEYASALIAIYELQEVEPMVDIYLHTYLRTCAAYDSTIKAIGYDAIRVRYRAERREAIREIISNELVNRPLESFIKEYAKKIPEEYRKDFIQDIEEDLEQIDESRIIGIGISPDQLKKWLSL